MPIINQKTREESLQGNPFIQAYLNGQITEKDVPALQAKYGGGGMDTGMGGLQGGIANAANMFAQRAGMTTPKDTSNDINTLMMKEYAKSAFKPEPAAKEWKPTTQEEAIAFEKAKLGIKAENETANKTPQTIKAEMDLADRKRRNELNAQNIKDSAQDTLDTIDKVEKGINYFGAGSLVPAIPTLQPQKIEWQNNLKKLLSGKIIDLISTMKSVSKTGATGFGQLSDREGQILSEASTALKGVSSPKEAKEILGKMKIKLQKVVGSGIPQFNNEQEAEASGIKGEVMIGGRRARID